MPRSVSRSRFLATGAAGAAAIAFPNVVLGEAATLRVGATANDTYAEAYYAQDLGYFKDAGLNVTLSTFANGGAVAAGVAGGSLDVGITNPVQLATAVGHGLDFQYIASGGLYSTEAPTTLLCVAKDGPIKTAKDFDGKTITASQVGDITSAAAMAWLEKNGANTSTIKMTEMPFSQMGPALARGTVAGATISEPSLTNAIRAGEARAFGKLFDIIAPHFMIGGWFGKREWIAQNRETAKKFADVIYRTAKWANANPEKSAELLGHYSKIPLASLKVMTRCKYGESFPEVYVTAPIELAFKAKLIAKPIPASQIIAKI